MKSDCSFVEHEVESRLKQKRKLKPFINALIESKTGKVNHIQYVFCTDKFLLGINKQFLEHDSYTDIITFDLSEQQRDLLTAEIYISIERVKENAKTEQTSYQDELLRVIFHGALHMCGFKDKSKREASIMREQENECLKNFYNL